MTTNAGATELSKSSIGFMKNSNQGADTEAIERLFAPEFRNRLDSIIPFDYLKIDVIRMVVDKFIMQLEVQLSDKSVSIVLSDNARDWLAKKRYDKVWRKTSWKTNTGEYKKTSCRRAFIWEFNFWWNCVC